MAAEDPTGRIRLLLLFGGRSAEHEVSCVSAAHVLRALDPARYDVLPVGITRKGEWVVSEQGQAALGPGAPAPAELTAAGPAVDPLPALAEGEATGPVVVFPLLHGPLGEDGTVQGLLEVAGVPYVGSGVLGSAVAMDKAMAKTVLAAHGIPQGRWFAVRRGVDDRGAARRAGEELGWPVFVKPANLGSSVGVSRADDEEAAAAALDLAFAYDEWVVVEEGIAGREIECSVLGNGPYEASVPGEVVPSRDFYDYEDKYVVDGAQLLVPAPLDPAVADEVRAMAATAAGALRVEGMARVDFFYEEGGRGILVNEVNTIPGFTPISMYPKLWLASGLTYADLVDRLVELALERHARRAGFRDATHRGPALPEG
ncbi:MAG TPA: D-alanine--D-alanine ligase family protein [Acidimicrobiales bacterium]|jgi:D-alanine-D-alanine ligase